MIRLAAVAARIRWTASMVASVPELANRHSGDSRWRLLGDDDRLGGLGEVGAARDAVLDGADRRVGGQPDAA
ncbi:MAG: hypothetical protein U0R78_05335 [Nocardioidaceae bacterium]